MLEKIEIENFKKHEKLSCSFEGGVNLVVGKNWAGKSTLLWAIVYALFGPSYVPGGSKLVAPKSGGKPSVRLYMSLHGHSYEVLRSPDKVELLEDGTLIANGASTVTEAIEELLGMTAATFTTLRMAQQNEAAAILTLGVTKLSQIVDQITKVDIVDRVISEATQNANTLKQRLESSQEFDLEAMKARVTEADVARRGAQAAKEAAETEKLRCSEASATAQQVWRKLSKQMEDFQQQERENQEAKEKIAAATGRLHAIEKEAQVAEIDLVPLQDDVERWSNLIAWRGKVNELEAHTAFVKTELDVAEYQSSIDYPWSAEAEAELLEVEEAGKVAQHEIWTTRLKIDDAVEAIKGGACPACGRPFEDHDPAQLQEELSVLQQLYAEQMARYQQANSKLVERSNRKRAVLDFAKKLGDLRLIYEDAKKRLDMASSYLSQLPPVISANYNEAAEKLAEGRLSNARRSAAITESNKLREDLSKQQAKLSTACGVSQPSAEDLQAAESSYYSSEAAKYQATEALHACTLASSSAATAHVQAVEALKIAAKAEGLRLELSSRLALNKGLVTYLRKNRDVFTARVWEHLLQTCSSFVSAATGGQVSEVSRTADGQFQYLEHLGGQQEGSWMPVGAASGVQQAIIGVGVRMALAEALGGSTGFLLLDEITAGAHDDLSIEIVRALAEVNAQAVVVTHRQADASVADNLITL